MIYRQRYEYILNNLRNDILNLGHLVEEALEHVTLSLEKANVTTAGWIIRDDMKIDEARYTIEERAASVLAMQQPVVAGDLRLVNVIIAMATELERIGDYAKGIAKRIRNMSKGTVRVDPPVQMFTMAQLAQQMLHTSLEAFLHQDSELARSLKQEDVRVDALEDELRTELINLVHADSQRIDTVIYLLDIIHLFERVADRATNIGERVIYLSTSSLEDLNP